MCLKLKIQSKSLPLADNLGSAFSASLASIACRVRECETSVTALSNYYIYKTSQYFFLSHFSNDNHKSRTARKIGLLQQDTQSVNVTFVNQKIKTKTKCDTLPRKVYKVAGSERRYTPEQVM